MKLPKTRGKWSPAGNRKAGQLDKIAAPYLKTRAGDGSIVKKSGKFLTVFGPEVDEIPKLDGIYFIGFLGDDTQSTVLGGSSIKGPFKLRSDFGGQFTDPTALNAGRGRIGISGDAESFEAAPNDFLNNAVTFVRESIYSSLDGRTFTKLYDQPTVSRGSLAISLIGDRAAFGGISLSASAVSGDILVQGTSRVYADSNQPCHFFFYCREPLGGGPKSTGAVKIPHVPNQVVDAELVLSRFAAGHFMHVANSLWLNRTPSPILNGQTPGLTVNESFDGGMTWAASSAGANLYEPELSQMKDALPWDDDKPARALIWNRTVRRASSGGITVIPIRPGVNAFVATVPYLIGAGDTAIPGQKIKFGIRYGSGPFLVWGVLGSGSSVDPVPFVRSWVTINNPDDPHAIVYMAGWPSAPNDVRVYRVSEVGFTLLTTWPSALIGLGSMFGYRPGEYFGVFRATYERETGDVIGSALYRSTDGISWEFFENVYVPEPGQPEPGFNDFASPEIVRREGVAVLERQDAPWMHDYRKEY